MLAFKLLATVYAHVICLKNSMMTFIYSLGAVLFHSDFIRLELFTDLGGCHVTVSDLIFTHEYTTQEFRDVW